MRKTIAIAVCATVGALAVLLALVFFSGYPEGYCHFYPAIDTRYAEGFSEEDFARLKVGMTKTEVEEFMGAPLQTWKDETGLVKLFWTADGKAPFGDFAWLGRGIEIRDGIATRVVNRIYYD